MIDLNTETIRQLISRNIKQKKTTAIILFSKEYINFKNEESNLTFDNKLDILTINTHNIGIEEIVIEMAREDGEIIGENKIINKLIRNLIINFKFTEEQTAEALDLPVYRISETCKQLAI